MWGLRSDPREGPHWGCLRHGRGLRAVPGASLVGVWRETARHSRARRPPPRRTLSRLLLERIVVFERARGDVRLGSLDAFLFKTLGRPAVPELPVGGRELAKAPPRQSAVASVSPQGRRVTGRDLLNRSRSSVPAAPLGQLRGHILPHRSGFTAPTTPAATSPFTETSPCSQTTSAPG